MTERLLQYIWQFQYFNRQALQTTAGEAVEIVYPGEKNQNQGPDFKGARIKISDVLWVGEVELHVFSSGWLYHHHHVDEEYKKVILHVVYTDDKPVKDGNGNLLPTIVLYDRISSIMLQRYASWVRLPHIIPCQNDIQAVSTLVMQSWQQRLLVERLQQKTTHIDQLLQQSNNNWEQVCWQLTCRYFGGTVNADSFEQIAASLPITLLAKHKEQLHQLEALLLGQAGFLDALFTDQHPLLFQREYNFLQAKYSLQPVSRKPVFLRMRPPGFPTVRLAQLAMLLHRSVHLFSNIREATSAENITALFDVTAGPFWDTHYQLYQEAEYLPKKSGSQLTDTLLINVAVPLLFAYGRHLAETKYTDRALVLLEELKAEKNNVTTAFVQLGVENSNAFTSQALLQLKKNYCDHLRCLECAVGNALLKRTA